MIRQRLVALVLLGAAALATIGAQAQQYRWVDDKGRVNYSDAPPPSSAKQVNQKNLSPGTAAKAQPSFEISRLQQTFPVTLYTSPPCKEGCGDARALLNKRGVPFKEVVVLDEDSNAELKKVSGGNEVPVLVVGRTAQKGFEAGAFDGLLDTAGYPKAGVLPARSQTPPALPEGYVAPGERQSAVKAEPAEAPKSEPGPAGPYSPGSKAPARPPRVPSK